MSFGKVSSFSMPPKFGCLLFRTHKSLKIFVSREVVDPRYSLEEFDNAWRRSESSHGTDCRR